MDRIEALPTETIATVSDNNFRGTDVTDVDVNSSSVDSASFVEPALLSNPYDKNGKKNTVVVKESKSSGFKP
jgi:hypothetical protein